MNLAVILLNYNDYDSTIRFLKFHYEFKIIYKIILVDNFSNDSSFEILSHFIADNYSNRSQKIDLIKTSKNLGYAGGNNFGINYSLSKYEIDFFLIVNPDVEVPEKSIIKMIECLSKYDQVAQISPYSNDSHTIPAWKLPNYSTDLSKLFHKTKIDSFKDYLNDVSSNIDGYFVDVLPGSCFMIKRSIFVELNLFDPRTFLYCEEEILAKKISLINMKNFLLSSKFYFNHTSSTTINKSIKSIFIKYKHLRSSKFIFHRYYLKKSIWICYFYSFLHLLYTFGLMTVKKKL
jgi:GT2 family glycosyltransferase